MDLMDAVMFNSVQDVKRLLKEGANPNMLDEWNGATPLHCAALFNCPDVIPPLLLAGANQDARLNLSKTSPLDIAVYLKHHQVIQALTHHAIYIKESRFQLQKHVNKIY